MPKGLSGSIGFDRLEKLLEGKVSDADIVNLEVEINASDNAKKTIKETSKELDKIKKNKINIDEQIVVRKDEIEKKAKEATKILNDALNKRDKINKMDDNWEDIKASDQFNAKEIKAILSAYGTLSGLKRSIPKGTTDFLKGNKSKGILPIFNSKYIPNSVSSSDLFIDQDVKNFQKVKRGEIYAQRINPKYTSKSYKEAGQLLADYEILVKTNEESKKLVENYEKINQAKKDSSGQVNNNIDQIIDEEKKINDVIEAEEKLSEARKEAASSTSAASASETKDQISSIEESIDGLERESVQLEGVKTSAVDAAQAKLEFVNANKEVLQSIISSLSGLDGEGNAFKEINKILKTLSGGDNVDTIASSISRLREELNKDLSPNGLVKSLQDLVNTGVDLKSLASVLENITKKNAAIISNSMPSTGKDKSKSIKNSYNQELSIKKEILDLEQKISMAKAKGDSNYDEVRAKYEPRISALKEELNSVNRVRKSQNLYDKELRKQVDQQIASIKRKNDAIVEGTANATEIQSRNKIQSGISGYLDDLKKLAESDKYTTEFKDNVKDVISELTKLNEAADSLDLTELQSQFEEVSKSSKNIIDEKTFAKNKAIAEKNMSALEAKIAKFASTNTAMGAKFSKELDILREKLANATNKVDFDKVISEFNELQAAVNNAGKTGLSTWDKFTKRLTSLSMSALARYFSFYDIIRYAKQAVQTIQELDTALIDLRKTTTMTASELNQFYYDANDVAKQMGVTTEEIINQAAAWSRLNKIGLLYGNI